MSLKRLIEFGNDNNVGQLEDVYIIHRDKADALLAQGDALRKRIHDLEWTIAIQSVEIERLRSYLQENVKGEKP